MSYKEIGYSLGRIFVFLLVFISLCMQSASAVIYNPGETLEPACGPTESNCGVRSPVATTDTMSDGALLFADSGNWSLLSAGADGKVLKLSDGVPTWGNDDGGTSYLAGSGLSLGGSTFALDMTNANNWTGVQTFGSGFSVGGNTYTNLAGTGLSFSGGTLSSSLGTSIDTSEITDSAVTAAKIANGTITFGKIGQNGCANGEIMKWNGSAWGCSADNNNTYTAGTGLSLTGAALALDINGLSAVSSAASTDMIALYTGSGLKKISQNDLFSGILGSLNYRGTWNAGLNSPSLSGVCSVGTKGYYYVVGTAGATNLDGISSWAINDWAVCSGTVWQKIQTTNAVTSVFGRTGAITASGGDYAAAQITNTPGGNIAAVTVQNALNELDSEKQSNSLNSGLLWIGNASNQAAAVALSGDATVSNAGVLTIGADAVALGTDTTGNYVAGATANGGLSLTGTEGGTLGIALNGSTLSLGVSGLALNLGNANTWTATQTFNNAIVAPTSTNTINGLVINSGALSNISSVTGSGALTVAAGGSNQNITLTPSGTGYTILNGNVGIGTTSPQAKLDVNGKVAINGTQTIYNAQASGGFTGSLFIGNGGNSLSHASGDDAYYNTGLGVGALFADTTGKYNTASGNQALYSNTTGSDNTADGMYALYGNTTGSFNTASGFGALYINTAGFNNTALGYEAGLFLADDSAANRTSDNSLYLGYRARANTNGDTNEIVIGADAIGIGSNSVVLGNDSITTTALKGNVGIGTTNPGSYKLNVNGTLNAGAITAPTSTNTINGLVINSGTLSGITGLTMASGNFSQTGTGTFSTGTGTVNLNGNTIVSGSLAVKKGTDFSTTGTSTNVDFGNVSLVKLTGASAQTIDTIAGGSDGKLLTIINAATNAATIKDNSTATGTAANRIYTGTGADLTLAADASILLIYDSGASRWRVVGGSGSGGSGSSSIQSISGAGNVSGWGYTVKADTTTASFTATLPTAANNSGKFIEIIKTDNTTNTLAISPYGSEIINGSTNKIYLYSKGDSVVIRSDGTNSYIVADNRGSVGQSKSYMDATRTANQTTGLSVGDPVAFTSVSSSYGSDISLNISTGIFTLQAGKTYKLTGTVPYVISNGISQASFIWKDLTNNVLIGSGTHVVSAAAGNQHSEGGGPAVATITPSTNIQVQLEIRGVVNAVTGIGGSTDVTDTTRFMPDAYIEVISTPQNVVNTVDYGFVRYTGTDTSALADGAQISFDSTPAAGNMAYSGSKFTLLAGKTYDLTAQLVVYNTVNPTAGKFEFYDYTNSTSLSTSARSTSISPTGGLTGNAAGADILELVYTPTQNIQVGVRLIGHAGPNPGIVGAGGVATDNGSGGTYFKVSQIGSNAYAGLPFNYIGQAQASGALDNLNFDQTWNWSTATTQTGISLTGDSLTSGGLMGLATSSASAAGKLASISIGNASATATGLDITNLGTGLSMNIQGAVAFKKGTDYSTTGTSTNVNFGNTSLIRLTGASAQTIDTIAGGSDGRFLTIINAGTNSATIKDSSTAAGTAANKIYTGTGADLTLAANASILLTYDSGASRWRVIGGSGSGGSGSSLIQSISSTGNVSGWGYTVKADTTTASFTATLPTAAGNSGKSIEIIKTDNTANALAISPFGSETINGSTNKIYLYSQNDSIVIRSDGTNSYIVADNRSSVGASKSYLQAQRTTSQSTGLSAGSPVIFNSVANSYGSDIGLNTSTGVFTLKAGKTYHLTGHASYIDNSGGASAAHFVWRDITNNQLIGVGAGLISSAANNWDAEGSVADAVITPSTDITVRLELRDGSIWIGDIGADGSGDSAADSARFQPYAYIEVISTPQNVVNTLDYVYATMSADQTANRTNGTDHVKFNTVSSGNIYLDTTTAYTSSTNVASLGRFTLLAGKTYSLEGASSNNQTNGNLELYWRDADSGNKLSSSNNTRQDSGQASGSSVSSAIFTPSVNTRVELFINSNTGSWNLLNAYSYAKITQIGSTVNTGITMNSLLAATGSGALDNLNFDQTWNWSTATTQTALTMTGNALTTGGLLSLTSSNNSLNSTNGLLYVANTGTSTNGMVARIQSNSTAGSGLTVLASGNVGIGTTAPGATLHVTKADTEGTPALDVEVAAVVQNNGNSTSWSALSVVGGTAGKSQIYFSDKDSQTAGTIQYDHSANTLLFATNGNNERMRINSSGYVGIGTTNPVWRFQVGETNNYGYVNSAGAWASSSDVRFKENITRIDNALDSVMQMEGIKYNVIGDDALQIGFSAQDMEKIFPEVVTTDANGYKGISYASLTPVLVNAIKEQQSEIEAIKVKVGISADMLDNLVVSGALEVSGEVNLGKDSVGEAVVKAGAGEVVVTFEKPYKYQPVVTISKNTQGVLSDYYVSEVSKAGFRIKLEPVQDKDITFSWHAFGSKDGLRIFSDGVREALETVATPVVPNDPAQAAEQTEQTEDQAISSGDNSDNDTESDDSVSTSNPDDTQNSGEVSVPDIISAPSSDSSAIDSGDSSANDQNPALSEGSADAPAGESDTAQIPLE